MEKKRIGILSNIMPDLIAQKLRREYEIYLPEGFDTWVQEVINPDSALHRTDLDAAIVLLDGTEARSWRDEAAGTERLELWKEAVRMLEAQMGVKPVFVTTIDIRENRIRAFSERKKRYDWERDWYQFIQELCEKTGHVFVLDLADRIADLGRDRAYSDKMWYMSSMPYGREGLQLVCGELRAALESAFQARKKILVLDLDNTLWGGVVGEDGAEGIELSDHKEGQRFFDFQRQLLEMKRRGTLLAVNSKNNPEDALPVIREHPAMLLREEDLVSEKINWQDKPSNLKEMEAELNLTEGSFVFLDDNPAEREQMKAACPEVLVPEFPEDTTTLIAFAEELYRSCLRPLRIMREDREKTAQYQAEARRSQDKASTLDLESYIKKLELRADIHRMRPEELERTAQLCGKTNQFNLTTKRYTEAELSELARDDGTRVYTVHSADKYGDNGLVSVLILKDEGDVSVIDSFLMSCRVMGRKLESVILREIASAQKGRVRKLRGIFIPTAKNAPVRELYDSMGFSLISEEEGTKVYELELDSYRGTAEDSYAQVLFEK